MADSPVPAPPKGIVSPDEAQAKQRERLQRLIGDMASSPWLEIVTAHIEAHDLDIRVGENPEGKPLGWVLEQITDETDVMERKRSIETASKVFFAISVELTRDLVPFAVAELEERLETVRQHPRVSELTGSVMEIITNPGDLSEPDARASLSWALGVAENVLGDNIDLDAVVDLMARAMDHVRPWFEYGWDAMLESHESDLAERSANTERPYTPFKVRCIQEALDTLKNDEAEGNSNFRALLATAGRRKALVLSVKGFEQTLFYNGQRLFDGDRNTFEQFKQLVEEVTGQPQSSKPKSVPTTGPAKGKGSRSSAARRKSTKATEAEKAEAAARTVEKPYAKTGAPNAQGPNEGETTRGRTVAHAGKSRTELAAKRKK